MKKLIEYTLESLDLYNVKTNDVAKYLKEKGIENFKYDDDEDYGLVVTMIYEYLNLKNIKYQKGIIEMNIKRDITIIITLLGLLGCYMLLNRNYMEGVNACIEKGNDINYCEYHASK